MNTHADDTYDVVVVGSGPGGATVARELARRGCRTLVLEKGSGAPIAGSRSQLIGMALIPGRSLHFTPQLVGLIHGVALGGSSVIYYANAFEPPYAMFDAYGIDLRPAVAEVQQELPIAPLRDDLVGPAARRIMDSARALGYDWHKLPKIVYQQHCRLDCDKCVMGCPYGAKWSARLFVEEAEEAGAHVVTGAEVERVLLNNGRAAGVAYVQRGRRRQIRAGTVVLAAGGIGTPLILRRSGLDRAGSDFFFDPLVIVMGEVDDAVGGREFPMAAGLNFTADGYIMTDLVLPDWLFQLFTAQVMRLDRLLAHSHTLPIMVKARDELGGRLTGGGGVRKQLGETEKKRLTSGYERARAILTNAGARHIYKTWYLAVHPGGTVKIGDVVDSNLQTEIDNLYVCDCSVIPESWGLPPTLTLLALGRRLGQQLTGSVA